MSVGFNSENHPPDFFRDLGDDGVAEGLDSLTSV